MRPFPNCAQAVKRGNAQRCCEIAVRPTPCCRFLQVQSEFLPEVQRLLEECRHACCALHGRTVQPAFNADLATSPENVNKDAHASWMVKLTLKNPGEVDGLLSAADYEKFVAEEAGH